MKQMIALWSMVMVHGLMVAGSALSCPVPLRYGAKPEIDEIVGRKTDKAREHLAIGNQM